MIAPIPTVARKALISVGTARRRAGSAVSSRRYAGLAIDWASPLMESERTDACAASARAIPASPCPRQPRFGWMCRISPNHFHWNRNAVICRESPISFSPRRRYRAKHGARPARKAAAVLCLRFAVGHPSDDVFDVARERFERGYFAQRRFGLA